MFETDGLNVDETRRRGVGLRLGVLYVVGTFRLGSFYVVSTKNETEPPCVTKTVRRKSE